MSTREYERWYERLVKAGYTPRAAHDRAATLARLVDRERVTTAAELQPTIDAREHDRRIYLMTLKRLIRAGFPPGLAEERADRDARQTVARLRSKVQR